MEGVMNNPMNVRSLTSPVLEMSQNTGLLLDNTLIHIPDSDTPPPTEPNNPNQVTTVKSLKWMVGSIKNGLHF